LRPLPRLQKTRKYIWLNIRSSTQNDTEHVTEI
jgi:hypothetical protein